jgi:hypothetical protein
MTLNATEQETMKRIMSVMAIAILAVGCATNSEPKLKAFSCTSSNEDMCHLERNVHDLKYQQALASHQRQQAETSVEHQQARETNCRLVHGDNSLYC